MTGAISSLPSATSASSRFISRFFVAKRNFTEEETRFFLNIDFISHVALIATLEEDGKQRIAGSGRFVVVEYQTG